MTTMAPPDIDLTAIRAAIAAATEQPQPPSEPAPEPPRPSSPMPVLEANPTLDEAIIAALTKLYPGDSKTATGRRDKILTAIADELGELYVYGIDLDGRVPIGEPIELGNCRIEVDGYGDAVRIVVDGGTPLWNPEP